MPIPERVSLNFYQYANWQCKFVLWPRRCSISNRIIWLEYAYCGITVWPGHGEYDDVERHWHSIQEHIIWQLKGNQ